MPTIDVAVQSPVSTTVRARQMRAMFDVPLAATQRLEWQINAPFEKRPWSIGLIVGPSGSGKSTIARHLWPEQFAWRCEWGAASVVDDFPDTASTEDIANVCMAVGFNTIPAWMRPFAVLSTGEKFRVEIARRLIDGSQLIVFDEFTSVVDRQVARIGCHAVQKYVRRQEGRQFVAVTCHEDVEDWLQPDWVVEPAKGSFRWRSLQPRPRLDAIIEWQPWEAWRLFAPFHYLTSDLHRSAQCFVLSIEGRPASVAAMMQRPTDTKDIVGCSRLVTLPDYQGLGLAFVLIDRVAAAFAAINIRTRCYPAHPALVRSYDKSKAWSLIQRPGSFTGAAHSTKELTRRRSRSGSAVTSAQKGIGRWAKSYGTRQCAIFEYCGPEMEMQDARTLLGARPNAWWTKKPRWKAEAAQ